MAQRVALITGSTSGIGLGIARALASKGHSILLTGLGSEELIRQRQDEIQNQYHVPVTYFAGDLSQSRDIDDICGEVKKKYPDGVDILVNNAGFQYVSPVGDFPLDTWNSMLSLMLTAPFLLTKKLLPNMTRKGWGRIINVSSTHGHVASVHKAGYVTCKHGIIGLTKVVAIETARTGVTCNAICPGWVSTDLVLKQVAELAARNNISETEAKELLLEKHPSKECTTVEQVGEAVNFMCSSACDNMTGSSLVVDGGWIAV